MPEEISGGFEGFKPEDYLVPCDECGKDVNLLENHVRGHFTVQRVIPFFDPSQVNGATQGVLKGAAEAEGVYHNVECFAKAVSAKHEKDSLPMMAQEEGEFPYGENEEQYQKDSEKHTKAIRAGLAKQVNES